MIHLNAKRVKKASGTKRDKLRREQELADRYADSNNTVSDTAADELTNRLTKDSRGVAIAQRNPWSKKIPKDRYGFWTDFVSSNIDGIDYDSDKRQLWVRFHSGAVYTYFNVSPKIAEGFYSTSSKGHYFWKNIRNNKHIKYQKLHANRHWTFIKGGIDLSSFAMQEMRCLP